MMADHADNAEMYFALEERAAKARLERCREELERCREKTVEPAGQCVNCDADIALGKIYCDGTCEKDHAWFVQRSNANR